MEWIITNDLLWPIQPLVENRMIKEALTLLFTNIEKERDFYRQAVKLEGQNSFESIAEQSVTGVLLDIIMKSPGGGAAKFSWLTPERIATYYARDMCYVVISWIKSGFVISSKELVEIYQYIMRRSMDDVLFGE